MKNSNTKVNALLTFNLAYKKNIFLYRKNKGDIKIHKIQNYNPCNYNP